ncbi:hypothetical protein [Halobacteriovorax sp. RT-1-4]|uniref:hypothetical protein n=1 Tax=unclassified Halobacteriovorax TaxID=2639665 RepID=UPI003999A8FC
MRNLICLLITLLSVKVSAVTYTMDDLRVLYKDKSHREYMKHFLDVRPSQRDFEWKKMTREMATSYVEDLITKNEINSTQFKIITKYIENKNLKAYAFFTLAYSKYARLYFQKCNDCQKDLDTYISHSARYPDIDFDIYKTLSNSLQSKYDNLVKAPLKSNDSIYYCREEQGQKAFLQIIVKEISRTDTKASIIEKAKDIFNPDCLNGFAKSDLESLLKPSDYNSEIIFLTFNAFDKIDEQLKSVFLTNYLLTNPIPGPVMNMAWNKMEELSANYDSRKKVLTDLLKYHPLRGEIFHRRNGKASTKTKVIIKRFAKNFPEYIENYAQICLSFYDGKKKFPRGNPARYCDDFMNEDVAGQWLSDEVRLQYSGAKKIK